MKLRSEDKIILQSHCYFLCPSDMDSFCGEHKLLPKLQISRLCEIVVEKDRWGSASEIWMWDVDLTMPSQVEAGTD